jgi:quinohemoprotein ethanol dehydrogenase
VSARRRGPARAHDAALASEPSGTEGRAYGPTSDEQRFSPLDQVNDGNVAGLSVDWFIDLPTDKGLVSTPLVVDGVLYFVGSMNVVRAVDATSGELTSASRPRWVWPSQGAAEAIELSVARVIS